MKLVIHAVVRKGEESGYVGECLDLGVVTQGATLDEVTRNLREAIALHLEGEPPGAFGLAARAPIIVSYEMEPVGGEAETAERA